VDRRFALVRFGVAIVSLECWVSGAGRRRSISLHPIPIAAPNDKGEVSTMVNYLELPVGDRAPEVFRAVIEIPKDATNKFEYDKQLHVFKLDRNLHSPVHYPGDYGFIPSTLSDDGDPLDVLVLVPGPSFPGCVQEVRPIGLLEMLDQGVLDEKVLAVGKNNPRYTNVWNYTDIYPHMLKEITHFFSIYKDLEGKRVEVKGWHDASYARDRVVRAVKMFADNKNKPAAIAAPKLKNVKVAASAKSA
jgi:inorganic pyrophosphatase